MRPYGSKRSFDTEPRIKSARAMVKRHAEGHIREFDDILDLDREMEALPEFCTKECCRPKTEP